MALIAFNQAHSDDFHRIYGYRVQIGDDFPGLFLPDQQPVVRDFMLRALRAETFTAVEEFVWRAVTKPATGAPALC